MVRISYYDYTLSDIDGTEVVMEEYILPNNYALTQMFTDLMCVDVQVEESTAWQWSREEYLNVANFEADDALFRSIGVIDFTAGTCLAGLLGRMPEADIQKLLQSEYKMLSAELLGNLREVMNVFSALLNSDGMPHMALQEMQIILAPYSKNLIQSMQHPLARIDYSICVGNYPIGKLSYIVPT